MHVSGRISLLFAAIDKQALAGLVQLSFCSRAGTSHTTGKAFFSYITGTFVPSIPSSLARPNPLFQLHNLFFSSFYVDLLQREQDRSIGLPQISIWYQSISFPFFWTLLRHIIGPLLTQGVKRGAEQEAQVNFERYHLPNEILIDKSKKNIAFVTRACLPRQDRTVSCYIAIFTYIGAVFQNISLIYMEGFKKSITSSPNITPWSLRRISSTSMLRPYQAY